LHRAMIGNRLSGVIRNVRPSGAIRNVRLSSVIRNVSLHWNAAENVSADITALLKVESVTADLIALLKVESVKSDITTPLKVESVKFDLITPRKAGSVPSSLISHLKVENVSIGIIIPPKVKSVSSDSDFAGWDSILKSKDSRSGAAKSRGRESCDVAPNEPSAEGRRRSPAVTKLHSLSAARARSTRSQAG